MTLLALEYSTSINLVHGNSKVVSGTGTLVENGKSFRVKVRTICDKAAQLPQGQIVFAEPLA